MTQYPQVSEMTKRLAVDRYLSGKSLGEVTRWLVRAGAPVGESTLRKWVHLYAPGQMRTAAHTQQLTRDELVQPRWRETLDDKRYAIAARARTILAQFKPRRGGSMYPRGRT